MNIQCLAVVAIASARAPLLTPSNGQRTKNEVFIHIFAAKIHTEREILRAKRDAVDGLVPGWYRVGRYCAVSEERRQRKRDGSRRWQRGHLTEKFGSVLNSEGR